jgi:hypothetical protein
MKFIEVPSVLAAPAVESSASPQVMRKLMLKRSRADMCFSPRLSLRTHFASRISLGKKDAFHCKVEAVTANGLTVNGEEVEGWMGAMTMNCRNRATCWSPGLAPTQMTISVTAWLACRHRATDAIVVDVRIRGVQRRRSEGSNLART